MKLHLNLNKNSVKFSFNQAKHNQSVKDAYIQLSFISPNQTQPSVNKQNGAIMDEGRW